MNDNTYNNGLSQMAGKTDVADQLSHAADDLQSLAMTLRLIAEQLNDDKHA